MSNKYNMNVVICDPNAEAGKNSDVHLKLECEFSCNEKDYGNGHYVSIKNESLPFGKEIYDIRYDKSFNRNDKTTWLLNWAYSYWTGKNGAYEIKSIKIEEA